MAAMLGHRGADDHGADRLRSDALEFLEARKYMFDQPARLPVGRERQRMTDGQFAEAARPVYQSSLQHQEGMNELFEDEKSSHQVGGSSDVMKGIINHGRGYDDYGIGRKFQFISHPHAAAARDRPAPWNLGAAPAPARRGRPRDAEPSPRYVPSNALIGNHANDLDWCHDPTADQREAAAWGASANVGASEKARRINLTRNHGSQLAFGDHELNAGASERRQRAKDVVTARRRPVSLAARIAGHAAFHEKLLDDAMPQKPPAARPGLSRNPTQPIRALADNMSGLMSDDARPPPQPPAPFSGKSSLSQVVLSDGQPDPKPFNRFAHVRNANSSKFTNCFDDCAALPRAKRPARLRSRTGPAPGPHQASTNRAALRPPASPTPPPPTLTPPWPPTRRPRRTHSCRARPSQSRGLWCRVPATTTPPRRTTTVSSGYRLSKGRCR